MNREDIHTFIKAASGSNAEIVDHKDWVNTPCPLAFATHDGGTDSSPSFGISIDNLSSKYNCFTCGSKGTMTGLVKKLERLSGESYPLLEEYVEAEEIGGIIPTWDMGEDHNDEHNRVSEDTIYMYDTIDHHPYLDLRGFPAGVAELAGIRIDYKDEEIDGRERLLFPVYSITGGEKRFMGFTGRATDDNKILKVKDYYGLKKSEALLGIEYIKPEHKFIVTVEGLFAYLRLRQYGVPVVAIMGSNMSVDQANMLIEFGKPVYLMFDNDKAGFKARLDAKLLLRDHLPVFTVKYPKGTDGLDPDDLYEEEIGLMLREAELV